MENRIMPTARQFYDAHDSDDAVVMMIDFAKMHVEAALKAASEGQIKKDIYMMTEYGESMNWKESIMKSYPLENIK